MCDVAAAMTSSSTSSSPSSSESSKSECSRSASLHNWPTCLSCAFENSDMSTAWAKSAADRLAPIDWSSSSAGSGTTISCVANGLSFWIFGGATQCLTSPSAEQLTMPLEPPSKRTWVTHESWACTMQTRTTSCSCLHIFRTSHTLMLPSVEADARRTPSGLNASERTPCLCPTSFNFPWISICSDSSPLSSLKCQTHTEPSSLPQAHQSSSTVYCATQSTPLPPPPQNFPKAV
mmetsp:Transcript_124311/g.357207  ORF Transcript_124311/g.357207 Transcript_124311/m.357207 type:complete len:234 (-) Transcript_124311:820-1521(-)